MIKKAVKVFIAIVLLIALFYLTDWRKSLEIIRNVDILYVLICLIVLIFGYFLSSLRWAALLNVKGLTVPLLYLVKVIWIGAFFNNYLPSTIGGDSYRLNAFRKSGNLSVYAASIVMDRMTGFLSLLIFVSLTLMLRGHYFGNENIYLSVLATVAIFWVCFVAFFLFGYRFTPKLNQLSGRFKNSFIKFLYKSSVSLSQYSRDRSVLLISIFYSSCFYLSVIAYQYLVLLSLGISVPFIEVFFVAPLIPFISLLPVSINAIGLAEGAFVALYMQVGLSAEEALAAALLRRLIVFISSLGGGLLFLKKQDSRINEPF